MWPVNQLLRSFREGNERSVKAKQNIAVSILIKGASVVTSFILVPLTLGYLDDFQYGVWLTLSSIMMWMNYFDIGISCGLRNKLAEAMAQKDYQLGQIYVSTTVFFLAVITVILFAAYAIVHYWLDWYTILNVSRGAISDLNALVFIVFALFCVNFVLKFINMVYVANQMPMFSNLFLLLGNIFSLVAIYILKIYTEGDLGRVAIAFSLAPIAVYLLAYPYTFKVKYKELAPRFSAIRVKYAKELMGLGVQFFIIQMTCLVVFSTSNVLIAQLVGPEQVTPYNIAYKYFNAVTMVYFIVLTPLWSAITDAYVKQDMEWIRHSMRKMVRVWGIFSGITLLMWIVSPIAYRIWVGDEVEVPFLLSGLIAIYMVVLNWNNLFSFFSNGTGKIRVQLYANVITGLVFIPFAVFLGKTYSTGGVVFAMTLVLLPTSILLPIQYRKIINKSALGIWDK